MHFQLSRHRHADRLVRNPRTPGPRNPVTAPDDAAAQDLGPKPCPVYQAFHDTGLGEALQMSARLRKLDSTQNHFTHLKRRPHEAAEPYSATGDVAPMRTRFERDMTVSLQCHERLQLDQGDLGVRTRYLPGARVARFPEMAVAGHPGTLVVHARRAVGRRDSRSTAAPWL
jgi:hypothetical protein